MHRPAQRQRQLRSRLLVCAAAVPVILVASGCSSDSDSGSDGAKKDSGSKASASAKADGGGDKAAEVEKAVFGKLPEPCDVLSKKTLGELVPKAKDKSGKAGTSSDTATRGSCSWDSLDNNGVDGSQFRWLRVSTLRFDSDASLGTGAKRAQDNFAKQVADAQGTKDAKGLKAEPVQGVGDQATLVKYDLKKDKDTFKQQTFVTRVENAVITVDYNGAGLAGDKAPDAGELGKAAQKAAKETVDAVVAANKGGGKPAGSGDKSKDEKPKDDGKKDDAPKSDDKKSDAKASDSSKSDDDKSKASHKS
ncbi:DUF3558 domain-containing protein [Streptomyces kanamyceticus]|uniref:DUF3558 domain-containing protein n=1 Tax=Streptomyces kanamyceticus TaxID=1967 RepID=UPI0006E1AB00|nr:DUF3558 domain-containing protein [Streptomyces kanamyceticus]